MTKTITLSLPTPCSQKWSELTPTSQGAYCSTCTKVVVDFTKMSDDQIVKYFENARDNTCGRFSKNQLKTYTVFPPSTLRTGFPLFKAGLLALLFVVTKPSTSHAQVQQPRHNEQVHLNTDANAKSHAGTFRGIVRGADDHAPLPGVNVILKGTKVGTATDAFGQFEFPQQLQSGDVLVFSFIGMVTQEYTIKEKRDLNLEIPMAVCMDYDITGEVVVAGVYAEPRPTFWSKVKGLFGK